MDLEMSTVVNLLAHIGPEPFSLTHCGLVTLNGDTDLG